MLYGCGINIKDINPNVELIKIYWIDCFLDGFKLNTVDIKYKLNGISIK